MDNALPFLLTRHACAQRLLCDPRKVQDKLGSPDCFARVSWREDPSWMRQRVFPDDESPWLDDSDFGQILYSRFEAAKLCSLAHSAMAKRLKPVAVLLNADRRLPLYRRKDIEQLRANIASGAVKVQTRSLRGLKRGVYMVDAFHSLASELNVEQDRIRRQRQAPAAWSRLV
jgi:hypothetical protein